MELEDIDEDFEYAGECVCCDELLDMSEAGFCKECGYSFCWADCGTWHKGEHHCNNCIEADGGELYGKFTPTEKDQRLHELAKQYHEETEAYDRTVCSSKNKRGVAMPVDYYEHGLINRNALRVRKRLLDENPEIGREELHMAISRYAY